MSDNSADNERGNGLPAAALSRLRRLFRRVIPSGFSVATALVLLADMTTGRGQTTPAAPVTSAGRAELEYRCRKELARQKQLHPEAHPAVATALDDLAVSLRDQGRPAEAEILFREALAIRRKLHGPGHLEVADSLDNIAAMLQKQGKLVEAETVQREIVAMMKRFPASFCPERPAA